MRVCGQLPRGAQRAGVRVSPVGHEDTARKAAATTITKRPKRSAAKRMRFDLQLQTVTAAVLTVSELNELARNVVERELPLLWVRGEISNCVRSAAGHC